MAPGTVVRFSNDVSSEVKSIEMHHQALTEALPGDSIAFNIENVSVKDIRRGMVVGDAKNNPPKLCKSFVAQVIIVNVPYTIHTG